MSLLAAAHCWCCWFVQDSSLVCIQRAALLPWVDCCACNCPHSSTAACCQTNAYAEATGAQYVGGECALYLIYVAQPACNVLPWHLLPALLLLLLHAGSSGSRQLLYSQRGAAPGGPCSGVIAALSTLADHWHAAVHSKQQQQQPWAWGVWCAKGWAAAGQQPCFHVQRGGCKGEG